MKFKKIALGAALIALITILAIAPSAAIEPHHAVMAMVMISAAVTTPSSFTISEFCQRNAISKSFFYKLVNSGAGPRLMRVGAHTRISVESETAWKIDREAAAAVKQKAGHP